MRGIGVDIVEIARFARSSDEFTHLVLTDKEFEEYYRRNSSIFYLATRFAAKEAAVKALGYQLGFKYIEITNDVQGAPHLRFLTTGMGIKSTFVSISDEKDYAVAMVVLE